METVDLYRAIQQGRVKAAITGSGIAGVSVKVTRAKTSKPLKVRIPVGTLFVAGSDAAQNMVSTAAETVDLATTTTASFSVSAACANLHLDVPGEEDSFSVEESPEQAELLKVLPVLRTASASDEVTQAAVWIITDDADYDDLGTLVMGLGGAPFGGARAILEPEAAYAMMLIERAKVDLKESAIWGDRSRVCEEVVGTQANAAAWCATVLRDTSDLEWRLESLDSEKRAVRNIARTALTKESSPEALPQLLEAFPKLKGDAAATVARALGNYSAPEAAEVLSRALESTDHPIQLAAAEILLKSEDAERREAAQAVLARLRPRTAAAKPAAAKPSSPARRPPAPPTKKR